MVTRSDSTEVRFHPNLTNNKVSVADVNFAHGTQGPQRGRGESDGRGTYRAMLANTHNETGGLSKDETEEKYGTKKKSQEKGSKTAVAVATSSTGSEWQRNSSVPTSSKPAVAGSQKWQPQDWGVQDSSAAAKWQSWWPRDQSWNNSSAWGETKDRDTMS